MNPKSVAILMATYNGEKYLSEQIDSIIAQTNKDWTLYIQDDGSKDSTIDIIQKYAKDERIVWIDCGLTKQGPCINFMNMLNMVESKYYMFCDQDDVWFPNKVDISLTKIKELELNHPDIPILVHTDCKRVNEQLQVIIDSQVNRNHDSFEKLNRRMNVLSQKGQLLLGPMNIGCLMCFNHKAKEVSFPFCNAKMHDFVVPLAVAKHNGIICLINQTAMFYRIHSSNVCGITKESSILSKFYHLKNTWQGNMKMFYLYKIYGGSGVFTFIKLRFERFLHRGF
jgi:glycosyltransferase involved in cell wall biosynthesis